MPSPLGHSLAGYAAARLTRIRITRDERLLFAFAALVAVLPDLIGQTLTYLVDTSPHGFAHSLAALLLVAALAAALGTRRGFRFWPVFALVAAAYGSHLLADLLRPEASPQDGEQLFWPLPATFGITLNIFPHIPDRAEHPAFLDYALTLAAIAAREALILGPIALLAHLVPPRIPARVDSRTLAPASPGDPLARGSADPGTR